jgi:hypothetical protein
MTDDYVAVFIIEVSLLWDLYSGDLSYSGLLGWDIMQSWYIYF